MILNERLSDRDVDQSHASWSENSVLSAVECGGRSPGTGYVEPKVLLGIVEQRFRTNDKGGALAYLDVVGPHDDAPFERQFCLQADETDEAGDTGITDEIGRTLGPSDMFCWYGGRFIIFIERASSAARTLARISRVITGREWVSQGVTMHLTPVIGYSHIGVTRSVRELWELADEALEQARFSLEVAPFRYVKPRRRAGPNRLLLGPAKLWGKAPQWLVLTTQLMISLLVGLGGPFLLYAICDALGSDISGPVYVGVVVVLVVTAGTIWIEGFLALKPTTPPAEPGSPYPLATVIIPAYLPNECDTIMETLHAFLRLEYANTVQIIIAYNGPAPHLPIEDEMKALAAAHAAGGRFLIEPVRVTGSTSKAQNVNAVIGRVKGRFVGIFDADHHPHADSLERAWRWLSNGWDIVQGRCTIRNGTDSWVARMVAIEFEQIYAVSHPGRARFHGFGIFGGSNGFWRTSVLHETRMRHSMLTEDIDSSIRAVVAGYRITGDRDLVSEELAPIAMKQLLNQRLRWAQGWFQVSLRRIIPALVSPHVTIRQKFGLLHLLVWRELFPWYSIQVVPIMIYWVWIYGWAYINWTVPIFLLTTVFTVSTGPGQILIAYHLAHSPVKRRKSWFVEYLFVSTFFYSPFKDALSRIAHVKEAMRERAWKVTPRSTIATAAPNPQRVEMVAAAASAAVLLGLLVPSVTRAQATAPGLLNQSSSELFATLLGGEASTINAARIAARERRNAEAAMLFGKAIHDVPRRRGELLHEYADALTYASRSREAVPLYRELLSSVRDTGQRGAIGAQLALALTWSRQFGPALGTYDDLLRHDPASADLVVHRARVLVWLGRPDEAVAALDKLSSGSWALGSLGTLAGDILVESARSKARSGDHAAAIALYARAIRRDGRLRTVLSAELNSQIAGLKQVVASAPAPGVGISSPTGQQASFARSGIVDTTIDNARAAAREDRNKDAQALFADVIRIDPGRRNEVLREYADQLSFNGRAADAVPLYRELLGSVTLSIADRKQAKVGLANAYVWSDRPKDALAVYDELVVAYPDDPNLQWTGLVVAARLAARTDRNEEAVTLFAKAIASAPGRRGGLLREYADQLSFAHHAVDAVPLYKEALSRAGITADDRMAIKTSLAQAYEWSDRLDLAEASYRELHEQKPDDSLLEWKLLVVTAREAARADYNRAAAELFAKAIRLMPDHSAGILCEYADQLSFTGRSQAATGFYKVSLNSPGLTAKARVAINLSLAQAYDWSGRYDDARTIYTALLADTHGDAMLRWHMLVVSARKAASEDHNKESAQLFAEAIRVAPAQRMAILKEYADQLTYTGRTKLAIPFYREIVQTEPRPAVKRNASLSLAQALAWNRDFGGALGEYKRLADTDPADVDAAVGVGRTLSWASRQSDAKAAFRRVLARYPDNGEALRGLAQAEDWDGHHRAAQTLLTRRLQSQPDDVDARRLLAQSLVWSGRPDKALDEVHRALEYQRKPSRRMPVSRQALAGLEALPPKTTRTPVEVATSSQDPVDGQTR